MFVVIVPGLASAHSARMKKPPHPPIRISIVIFARCQIVDATGAAGVFGTANEVLRRTPGSAPLYDIRFLALETGPVPTSAGVSLHADHAISERTAALDTLICAGGKGADAAAADAAIVKDVTRLAASARRVVSVCTGAYILAAAGLLDGRRAATHWAHCRRLAEAYPRIDVDPESIYVKDGNVYTSAGVTAGMDLALALVEADHGRELALAVARDMVMFLKRPGSQAQFSVHLEAQTAPAGGIRDAQLWLLDHLKERIDVETLADRAAMSPRTFYRRFLEVTGRTPARFIVECRLDAARRLIEESPMPVKTIAAHCGFGDSGRMRRAFHRHYGIGPDDYRCRFSPTSDGFQGDMQ